MNRFVLDCSVAMAWCFEDEGDRYAVAVLERLSRQEAVVPSLWPLEMANALLVAERRGRLREAESSRFLALVRALPIDVDDVQLDQTLDEILSLGRRYRLSSYDAAYLELAARHGLPLATLDDSLRKAAAKTGVALVR